MPRYVVHHNGGYYTVDRRQRLSSENDKSATETPPTPVHRSSQDIVPATRRFSPLTPPPPSGYDNNFYIVRYEL